MQLDKGRSGASFPTFESLSLKTQKVKEKKTVNQFLFARSLLLFISRVWFHTPHPVEGEGGGGGGDEIVETNDQNEF